MIEGILLVRSNTGRSKRRRATKIFLHGRQVAGGILQADDLWDRRSRGFQTMIVAHERVDRMVIVAMVTF